MANDQGHAERGWLVSDTTISSDEHTPSLDTCLDSYLMMFGYFNLSLNGWREGEIEFLEKMTKLYYAGQGRTVVSPPGGIAWNFIQLIKELAKVRYGEPLQRPDLWKLTNSDPG